MSFKHLANGAKNPPLKRDLLRLYSMIYCPFSERVRLVLSAKNITYEVVNINTKDKPNWYLELNPLGQTPCLQHGDGRSLPDSLIIADYLDDIYPEPRLSPLEPYERARQRLVVEIFSKVIIQYFQIIRKETDKTDDFTASLHAIENRLADAYFGGDCPRLVDYMIWPWLERLPAFEKVSNFSIDHSFVKLRSYIERMMQQPAVREVSLPTERHTMYFRALMSNEMPDFDSALTQQASQ